MDGVGPPLLCQGHNLVDGQIGSQGSQGLAHNVGLIGLGSEAAENVFLGVDCHGAQTQVVTGPDNANGNLAPVCHQDFLDLLLLHEVSSLKKHRCHLCILILPFKLNIKME